MHSEPVGIFNALVGQILTDLSAPAGALKYEKTKYKFNQ